MGSPHLTDSNEATNQGLWKRMLDLAQGKAQRFQQGDTVVNAPNNGSGFRSWPNPNGIAWAVKQYNNLGGKWRPKESTVQRVVARYAKR